MALAGAAALLTVAGTGLQIFGQVKQQKAAERAEKLRKNQMNLEAERGKREQIRRAQVARAQATQNAVTQGAQFTSALEGGKAQVNNEAGRNYQAISQDQGIGNNIFKANRDYAKAGSIVALGQGVSSLGGSVGSVSGTFTKLGWA